MNPIGNYTYNNQLTQVVSDGKGGLIAINEVGVTSPMTWANGGNVTAFGTTGQLTSAGIVWANGGTWAFIPSVPVISTTNPTTFSFSSFFSGMTSNTLLLIGGVVVVGFFMFSGGNHRGR